MYRDLFSTIYQVLATLAFAQEVCHFTHSDLHSNNVILYDLDTPLAVDTRGFSAVIIDYEFSYIDGMNGSNLDCTHFDPISDPIRYVLGTLTYFSTKKGDNSERIIVHDKIYAIVSDILETINSSSSKKIRDDGLLEGEETLWKLTERELATTVELSS